VLRAGGALAKNFAYASFIAGKSDDCRLHDAIHTAAGGRENCSEILQHPLGLSSNVTFDQFPCGRIDGDLP
jgi:hypothetical protein